MILDGKLPPSVTFLLCVKNGASTIEDALDSIERQTFRDFEVIIVDNGSSDKTVDIVKGRGYDPQYATGSVSDARRLGCKAARGGMLFVIDADQVLAIDCLTHCVEALADLEVSAVIVPERAYRPANLFHRVLSCERDISERAGRGIPRVFRMSRYLEIGGYGDGLGFGEDADLKFRLLDEEVTMAREARIYHKELPSLWAMLRKYFEYGRKATANDALTEKVISGRAGQFLRIIALETLRGSVHAVLVLFLKVAKYSAVQMGRAHARGFDRRSRRACSN